MCIMTELLSRLKDAQGKIVSQTETIHDLRVANIALNAEVETLMHGNDVLHNCIVDVTTCVAVSKTVLWAPDIAINEIQSIIEKVSN